MTISPSRRKALEYFARFPSGTKWIDVVLGPSASMRRRMIREGELELLPPPGGIGMLTYKLTAIGRARLGL